jgi:hypothetical protein
MTTANQRSYTFDATMQLKDAGLIGASAAAQVGGSNQILDVGASPFMGVAVIDVSAIEIDTGNEDYQIIIQGSNSASFASGIENLAALDLGANSSGRKGGAQDSIAGRYELPFLNVQRDTVFRYIRAYTLVAGTIATGINYKAFVGEVPKGF